jgi:tetratricopeptide (TPR) repeat protein
MSGRASGRRVRGIAAGVVGIALAGVLAGCVDKENAVARHMERSDGYLAEGNLEKARIELRNAARIDPRNARARLKLGRIAEKNANWKRAYAHYQVAVSIDPALGEAHVALAALMLRFNELDRAQAAVDEALALQADDGEALAVSAWIARRRGDEATAQATNLRALEAAPDSMLALSLQSDILLQAGEQEAARALLEAAVARNPDAAEPLRLLVRTLERSGQAQEAMSVQRRVVALEPESSRHRQVLATMHLNAGDVDAAVASLEEAYEVVGSTELATALTQLIASRYPQADAIAALDGLMEAHPQEPVFGLLLASYYERAGRLDDGRAVLLDMIARAERLPDVLEARVQLARLHIIAGDDEAGERELTQVLEENPRDVDALVLRAQLAMARGAPEEAIVDLRLALDAGERQAELHRLLAEAYNSADEPEQALASMQAAVDAAPGNNTYRLALAQLALRLDDASGAATQLEALFAAGAESPALYELGFHVYERLGDLQRAGELAEAIVAQDPDRALGYFLRGRLLHSEQQFEAARDAYVKALQIAPDEGPVREALVRIHLALEQPERALALAEEGVALDPDDERLALLRGEVLTYVGDDEGAREAFAGVIAAKPSWWLPHLRLAELHVQRAEGDAAEAVLVAGLDATRWDPRLGERLTMLYYQGGRIEEAIDLLESLHSRRPDVPVVANNLAMLLVNHRADASSLARAERLVEPFAESSDPAFLDTVGWIRLKTGRVDEAVEVLERAVKAAPGRPTQRYHLAVAYQETGDERSARRELERALASNEPFPERADAQRRHQSLAVPDSSGEPGA